MTTRRKILKDLSASLEPIYGSREAKSISEIVAQSLLGWSRTDCMLEGEAVVQLSEDQCVGLAAAQKELLAFRPVQYVVGECEFCSLRFAVSEGVLIPRPETEELIGWIAGETNTAVRLLDIGTGSGAIAIALASRFAAESTTARGDISMDHVSKSRVSAIDISHEAIDIAAKNAHSNDVEVDFDQIDILAPRQEWLADDKYDIIVSNPPYIPLSDKSRMRENVLDYEPHIALFVEDSDPLIFYRTIAQHALRLLSPGGSLYFEIYEDFADELCLMLDRQGFTDIELRHDINEKPRMIRCRKSF